MPSLLSALAAPARAARSSVPPTGSPSSTTTCCATSACAGPTSTRLPHLHAVAHQGRLLPAARRRAPRSRRPTLPAAELSTGDLHDRHHILPVAVIGAGPVGLAAAAHLIERGIPVKVYEAGETVARQRARLGPRAPVLAVGLQHRRRGERPAEAARLAGAARRRLPDRLGPLRGLPAAARRNARR